MFLSPVFYPVAAVPERFRPFIMANPLTFIIEQAREVLIWGHLPNWLGLGVYTLAAIVVAWAGYAWFQKTRKGFADVL
jgi:lipopolysaccharide transport system permease protein